LQSDGTSLADAVLGEVQNAQVRKPLERAGDSDEPGREKDWHPVNCRQPAEIIVGARCI